MILCVGAHQCSLLGCKEDCLISQWTTAPLEILQFQPVDCALVPFADMSHIYSALSFDSGYRVCSMGMLETDCDKWLYSVQASLSIFKILIYKIDVENRFTQLWRSFTNLSFTQQLFNSNILLDLFINIWKLDTRFLIMFLVQSVYTGFCRLYDMNLISDVVHALSLIHWSLH